MLASADYVIGVYGFGVDGHIGGMKPTSHPEDFMRFLDGRLAVSYAAPDFRRITTTHAVLTRMDEAVVFGCGPDKLKQMNIFNSTDIPPHTQPMQLLKDLKHATFFIGDTA
jgi:6-phosphogluconolactonase/glucosamine-6-phosphate isomerase/deaminase